MTHIKIRARSFIDDHGALLVNNILWLQIIFRRPARIFSHLTGIFLCFLAVLPRSFVSQIVCTEKRHIYGLSYGGLCQPKTLSSSKIAFKQLWVGRGNIAFICRAIATLIASVESNFVTNYPVGSLHTYGN